MTFLLSSSLTSDCMGDEYDVGLTCGECKSVHSVWTLPLRPPVEAVAIHELYHATWCISYKSATS